MHVLHSCPTWLKETSCGHWKHGASKIAFGQKPHEMSYKERCKLLGWNTLECWREWYPFIESYKVVIVLSCLNSHDYIKYSNKNTRSTVQIHLGFIIYEIRKNWIPSNTSLCGSSRNGTSCQTTFREMISRWTLTDYTIYCPLCPPIFAVSQSHFCVLYVWPLHFIQMIYKCYLFLHQVWRRMIYKILIQLNQLLQLLINISCP